jgi:hypothetical protein
MEQGFVFDASEITEPGDDVPADAVPAFEVSFPQGKEKRNVFIFADLTFLLPFSFFRNPTACDAC